MRETAEAREADYSAFAEARGAGPVLLRTMSWGCSVYSAPMASVFCKVEKSA
jgi:hypothetical protein